MNNNRVLRRNRVLRQQKLDSMKWLKEERERQVDEMNGKDTEYRRPPPRR